MKAEAHGTKRIFYVEELNLGLFLNFNLAAANFNAVRCKATDIVWFHVGSTLRYLNAINPNFFSFLLIFPQVCAMFMIRVSQLPTLILFL